MPGKLRIAGVGEVLWDIYGDQKFPGGAPANFAIHVQRLGHQGALLSRVGKDLLGEELVDFLRRQGVDVSGIQVDPALPTGTVRIELDEQGVPHFLCTRNVAFDALEFPDCWLEKGWRFDALMFGTLAQRAAKSRHTIQRLIASRPAEWILFDVNLRGIQPETQQIVEFGLGQADLVKLNEEEARTLQSLLGADQQELVPFLQGLARRYGIRWIVVTFGPAGALAAGSAAVHYSPGFQVNAADTTGAGDAFAAAFVVRLLEGQPVEQALEFANALAALVCTRKGAVPDYSLSEVEEILRFSGEQRTVHQSLAQMTGTHRQAK